MDANTTTQTRRAYVLTITLRDGSSSSFTSKRRPRFITSWLMQQMPYGTDFQGMTYKCERSS